MPSKFGDDGDDTLIDGDDDVIIDADGADIILKDGGTEFGRFKRDSSDFVIKSATSDKDIIFRGNDGGSTITALTLDMSDSGKAIFSGDIGIGEYIYHNDDADTLIRFNDDKIVLKAGNKAMVTVEEKASAPHEVTINDGSNNIDFVVKGNGSRGGNPGIKFDASTNKLGINGVGTPEESLHVDGNIKVFGDDVRIKIDGDTDSHPGLELYENGTRKWIVYNDYSNDNLTFKTNTTQLFEIEQGGDVSVLAGALTCNGGVVVDNITIDGTEIDLSSGDLTLDVAGDIVLDAAGNNIFFDASGTRVMSIMNISSDVYLQPTVSNKDLCLATQGDNTVLTVDSSASALILNRNLGLATNTLMNSSAALSATAPFNKMVNTTGSDITGTLPDPTFEGQVQIILGVQTSSGNNIVSYKNAADGTTSKTLTNGVAITLISFDATGSGAYRWCPVGDVS